MSGFLGETDDITPRVPIPNWVTGETPHQPHRESLTQKKGKYWGEVLHPNPGVYIGM